MSDNLSKVDWTRPIEDENGVAMLFHHDKVTHVERYARYVTCPSDPMIVSYYDDFGRPWSTRKPLIRNVAEPVQAPSDDIAKLMEALVRNIARYGAYATDGSPYENEAKAIVALLPEPVDADREEAKRIAAEWYSEEAPHIDPLTAAIRRGRALERDSREG